MVQPRQRHNQSPPLLEAEACASTDPRKAEGLYKQILGGMGAGRWYILAFVCPLVEQAINLSVSNLASTTIDPQHPPTDETQAQILRDQEVALVKLGDLYRDQKYVLSFLYG